MIEEKIKNRFKEYYGDNFFEMNGPVGIVETLWGRKRAVEMGSLRLGFDEDEINKTLDSFIVDYPKDEWYFSFYKIYKKASNRLFTTFYKNGSRIPEKIISDADIEEYGDYHLRFNVYNIEEYKDKSYISNIDIFDFNYPKRQFYIYNCDLLYKKAYEEWNESLEKNDSYSLEPLNPVGYYIQKIGYFEYESEQDLLQKKRELESNIGTLFIQYVEDGRIGLIKRITHNKEIIYTTILDSAVNIIPTIKPEYISILEKLEVNNKEEFIDIRNKYVSLEYSHITVPMFNISVDRKCPIMDIVDYYKKYENGYCSEQIDEQKVLQTIYNNATKEQRCYIPKTPENIDTYEQIPSEFASDVRNNLP